MFACGGNADGINLFLDGTAQCFNATFAAKRHRFQRMAPKEIKFTAGELAMLLGGKVEGNAGATVSSLAKIEEATEGSVAFIANPLYNDYIYTTKASVVIVSKDFTIQKPLPQNMAVIRTEDARMAFAALLSKYAALINKKEGIHPAASIDKTAKIGKDVYIGPMASIGKNSVIGDHCQIHANVSIGDDCTVGSESILHQGVRIGDRCTLGKDCVLQPGVVLGGDGFGFAPNQENNYHKVPHLGNVVLEDHVEIGANTTVDRATLGSTIIRKGVKLDNLIQVAHNVEIGENTVIAAQTGIAGSTRIGSNCMIGGQVGIVGHITIANGTKIAAQSGIGHSIEKENQIVQGSPAMPIGDFKRSYVHFRNLPDMAEAINELKADKSR